MIQFGAYGHSYTLNKSYHQKPKKDLVAKAGSSLVAPAIQYSKPYVGTDWLRQMSVYWTRIRSALRCRSQPPPPAGEGGPPEAPREGPVASTPLEARFYASLFHYTAEKT